MPKPDIFGFLLMSLVDFLFPQLFPLTPPFPEIDSFVQYLLVNCCLRKTIMLPILPYRE